MGLFDLVQLHAVCACFLIIISNVNESKAIYGHHSSVKGMFDQIMVFVLPVREQHYKSIFFKNNIKPPSPIHQGSQSNHRSCNLTTALKTTYYSKFNYSGPIIEGLTCHTVYNCDGNFQSTSPTCDSFVFYLLYMEAYELSVRVQANSNNCIPSPPDALWTPQSGIFNYKEMVFNRDGIVTILQRQRTKLFSDLTKDQLTDSNYASLNQKYPREQLKKWSRHFYIYNKTEFDNNGNEFTEREQCLKSNAKWKCDTGERPNQEIVDSIPWHMNYMDALSGFLRIQFFLDNNQINRTGYHGMDGDGWNVTDTVISGLMAGPNWQNETVRRVLFFDKLWVEGCQCQNNIQPGENIVTKCEHWDLLKRNFDIPFKPAGLSFCPNMEKLKIPSDAFKEVS